MRTDRLHRFRALRIEPADLGSELMRACRSGSGSRNVWQEESRCQNSRRRFRNNWRKMMVLISASRPAWPEVLIGLSSFAVFMLVFALGFSLLPADQPVLQGVVRSTAGGIAGTAAFAAAIGIRIRSLRLFGFRPVPPRWLLIAAMLGVACYGITYLIQTINGMWFGQDDPQSILHAAARGGVIPFLASLAGGAVLTPFGEEVLFRGVVTNAWHRYGP
ncbi:hypothetical protein [Novosphingobium guangzhouense]|uniref:hypothetical protein n=1 Tax=Novosphingobium guangzhouense TaxID=1850347 RepID=UPI001B80E4D0|nr:hypothetical protein [Novosphingobium guangzhouense]